MPESTEPPDPGRRCPRCGASTFRIDPTYDEDDAPTGAVAVLCARCGYHLEDTTAARAIARWHAPAMPVG